METQKRCGQNLRRIREEKLMSSAALSVLSGISETDLLAIEEGRSANFITQLFLLADELNVDYRLILGRTVNSTGNLSVAN